MKRMREASRRVLKSIWLFPLLLTIPLIVLTSLGISGSSIGIYSMLDGADDPGVLTENYRGVRSDEWLVTSQMAVAQSKTGFSRFNPNIADGQDMSLMGDVPYKEWSSAFKPQNLAFLALPLEQAFAFRWWFLVFIVMLAVYFLALEIFPGRRRLSVLLATFTGLTPLIFWWYLPGTALSIAFSLLATVLALRVLRSPETKHKLLYSAGLTYILTCFALILYPPFQIPCAIACSFFFLGYFLENLTPQNRKKAFASLGYLAVACLVSVLIVVTFIKTRSRTVDLVTNTVYPGKRLELSGGVDPLKSFSSHLSPNLQYDSKNNGYLVNQSEASNFIFIAPYLFLPSLYLIIREKTKHKRLLWGLIATDAALVFFLARMYLPIRVLEPFYQLFMLDQVSSTRLLIGTGLAGIFQLMLIIKALHKTDLKPKEVKLLAVFAGLTGLIAMTLVGVYTIQRFPVFIASYPKVLVFSTWVAAGIFLVVLKRYTLGLAVLIAFSLFSIYRINPLYKGLAALTKAEPIKAIQSLPNDGSWVVLNDRLMTNFPLMAGRDSLTSVQFYPQFDLWSELDKDKEYEGVYNRYAHVIFSDDETLTEPFTLKSGDHFVVKFEPCEDFLQDNAKYVLSPKPLADACLLEREMVDLPARDFFIYQILDVTP